MPLCGTFEYIYWELGQSAPVGGRAARCAAPTAETWQARAARRVVAPCKRGVWSLPPHPPPSGAPSPRGKGFWGKHPSAVWLDRQSFTPLTRETAAYGRVRTPAPTAEFFGGNGGRTMCAPTGREGGNLPPHPLPPGAPSPQGEGSGKTKRDRSETCPLKHRGETQFRIKFLCFLSFSKKGSPGSKEPGLLAYCFSSGPLVPQPRGFLMAAWAAASRAIGTRKGEQDT